MVHMRLPTWWEGQGWASGKLGPGLSPLAPTQIMLDNAWILLPAGQGGAQPYLAIVFSRCLYESCLGLGFRAAVHRWFLRDSTG